MIGLTSITFLPALHNDFLNSWDDLGNFLINSNYRGLGTSNLRWMFTTHHLGHYVPITWLTLGLDYVLWGMSPWGYHLTSLIFHAANALLAFLLTYRLLELGYRDDALPASLRAAGATVGALVFAVHPLRVESVAWITERRDLVAGLFSLLTVLAYLTAFRRGMWSHGLHRLHRGWYWGAVGLFALALLSKSIVIGLPLVLLALDWYPLRRVPAGESARAFWVGLLPEKAPFLMLSVGMSILMLWIGVREKLFTGLGTLGPVERVAVSWYGLSFYLWKTLVPWPLSPLYELHYPVMPLSVRYLVPGLLVLAVTASVVALRRRWPGGAIAWLSYVILLLPVLGIFHNGHQIVADRYSYISCLGFSVLAAGGVVWSAKLRESLAISPGAFRLLLALAGVIVMSLAALTTLQIRVWRDAETLWRHAAALDPQSGLAHRCLADALFLAGRVEEARSEWEHAIALLPDQLPSERAASFTWIGVLLQDQGDLKGAERSYLAALSLYENDVNARTNLGVLQAQQGRPHAALDSFLRVLRLRPGYPRACSNARTLARQLEVAPVELRGCDLATRLQ